MKIISSTLGEICKVDWGNTKLTKSSYISGGEFLAVSAAGPDGRISHYEHESDVPVLSAIGAQCGKMFYPNEKFTAIKNTITLTPKKDLVDGKFLYYLLTYVELPQRGAGQPFISKGDIQSYKILIPKDIKNQIITVEKLDAAFAKIELLEKNIELKEEKTDQLLQSMLNNAFNHDQKSDMKFEKIQNISTFQGGSQPPKSNFIYENRKGYIRFLQIRDFKNENNITYIPDSKKNRICNSTDILIGRYGASVGQILTGLSGAYNVALMKATPDESKVLHTYFYYFLKSCHFQLPLSKVSSRSAQSGFTKEEIGSFLLPLPSLSDQKAIVKKIDKVFAEIELLKLLLAKEKQKISELRQSILSDAFNFADEAA